MESILPVLVAHLHSRDSLADKLVTIAAGLTATARGGRLPALSLRFGRR